MYYSILVKRIIVEFVNKLPSVLPNFLLRSNEKAGEKQKISRCIFRQREKRLFYAVCPKSLAEFAAYGGK